MSNAVYAVIMAGGGGTRLWPKSRRTQAKQYIDFGQGRTLIEETLDRLGEVVTLDRRFVCTVRAQEENLRALFGETFVREQVIYEPMGRNTAPCILLSLCTLRAKGALASDCVVFLPADHVVKDQIAFRQTLNQAVLVATSEQKVVTIGIRPTSPHTGYGYIECTPCGQVLSFKEKPSREVAESYLAATEHTYFWNAGIFVAPIGLLEEELTLHAPDIACFAPALDQHLHAPVEIYNLIPAVSIDYAVMEKSQRLALVPSRFDWSDLGAWDALAELVPSQSGNSIVQTVAPAHHVAIGAQNNCVMVNKKLVVLVDVQNLIVVEEGDTLMIMPNSSAQKVKDVVTHLQAQPWGANYL